MVMLELYCRTRDGCSIDTTRGPGSSLYFCLRPGGAINQAAEETAAMTITTGAAVVKARHFEKGAFSLPGCGENSRDGTKHVAQ